MMSESHRIGAVCDDMVPAVWRFGEERTDTGRRMRSHSRTAWSPDRLSQRREFDVLYNPEWGAMTANSLIEQAWTWSLVRRVSGNGAAAGAPDPHNVLGVDTDLISPCP